MKRLRSAPEFLLLGVAAGGFAYYVLRSAAFEREGDVRGRSPRLPMLLMGVYFAAVVFFAALLSAISGAVQDKGWDISPWRETGFTWMGWAVIIAIALTAFFDWLRDDPGVVVALSAIIAVLAFMTAVVNQADMASVNARLDTRLLNEAGLLLVNLDDTEQGNMQRCGVIADLRDFAANDSELRKMNLLGTYLDSAAENIYGVVFCDSGSS